MKYDNFSELAKLVIVKLLEASPQCVVIDGHPMLTNEMLEKTTGKYDLNMNGVPIDIEAFAKELNAGLEVIGRKRMAEMDARYAKFAEIEMSLERIYQALGQIDNEMNGISELLK